MTVQLSHLIEVDEVDGMKLSEIKKRFFKFSQMSGKSSSSHGVLYPQEMNCMMSNFSPFMHAVQQAIFQSNTQWTSRDSIIYHPTFQSINH